MNRLITMRKALKGPLARERPVLMIRTDRERTVMNG